MNKELIQANVPAIERAWQRTESCEDHGFREGCNQCMANFAAMLYQEGVDSDLGFLWLQSQNS